jgi:hypothetical protein
VILPKAGDGRPERSSGVRLWGHEDLARVSELALRAFLTLFVVQYVADGVRGLFRAG